MDGAACESKQVKEKAENEYTQKKQEKKKEK